MGSMISMRRFRYDVLTMERPLGVRIIASAFFLIAGYFFAISIMELAAPGAILPPWMTRAQFVYRREIAGPQSALLVSAGWALVGWGLYRLQNWARWSAVVLMTIGIVAGIPAVSAAAPGLNGRLAWYGGEMLARVVAVFFIIQSPEVTAAFKITE